MSYRIILPVFEGPFDLLLFLIKKNEVDIYDIPIAEITRQYLQYLEMMQLLDLDIAGEFIEMVATLMLIKVRMLLPKSEVSLEEEIGDPRAQLVAQLLEYKQFKEASFSLSDMENKQRRYFSRAVPRNDSNLTATEDEDLFLEDASLFDLLAAFKKALDEMPKVTVHQVNVLRVTLEDQVKFIFQQIGERPYLLFREMCRPLQTKMELIVTFMAMLDLLRLQFLSAKQSDIFGEIRLVVLQTLSMGKYFEIRDKEFFSKSSTAEVADSSPQM
jgi:segregation and condensation protein A